MNSAPAIPDDATPIAAIATPPGRGGVGIVRTSGQGLRTLLPRLLRTADVSAAPIATLVPRVARHCRVVDSTGALIDDVIALWFEAPHSFTGQDVLELHGHGGPVVLRMLLARVLEAGAPIGMRLARPGEFTERAFLNDKIDLAQAEAVADLIDAATESAARGAARSLAGEFSVAVNALVERLIALRTLVEATLDFPEEEIDFLEASDACGQLESIRARLAALLSAARQGALLRDGVTVVLAGAPNVGKSSLMNALAGEEVAIVTAVPGTTRDRIERTVAIDGVPMTLIDTAGLRETRDEVERIGIERSWRAIEQADILVSLSAADAGAGGADAALEARLVERMPRGATRLSVRNKIDLDADGSTTGAAPARSTVAGAAAIEVSALTGAGIAQLRARLLEAAGWHAGSGETVFVARARHLAALRAADERLAQASAHAARGDGALDLFAESLRLAQQALSSITGEFSADDLLGEIFGRFCIGK